MTLLKVSMIRTFTANRFVESLKVGGAIVLATTALFADLIMKTKISLC